MRNVATTLVFLLPASRAKNAVLRRLGHDVAPDARIGPNLARNVGRFEIGPGASVNVGNVFRDLTLVRLGTGARIGQWNWVTAAPSLFHESRDPGVLRVGDHATVVSRHYLDCTGGIELEHHAALGGVRTVFITHQADYRGTHLTAAGIRVGAYTLVNACNRLAPGAVVPARCITTMGAVISTGLTTEGRLYGGVPARDIKAVEGGWFEREGVAFGA